MAGAPCALAHLRPVGTCIDPVQGRFSADDNFLIFDRARYKADPQERGCACFPALLSIFSIRLSPPLCLGVVLESLEPEFRRFHAGRSELHAKKGAGVIFERTFFRGGIGGTRRLRVCKAEITRFRSAHYRDPADKTINYYDFTKQMP